MQNNKLLQDAIARAGYTGKIEIGMDVAASEFYKGDNTYDLDFKTDNNDGSQKISGDELCELYMEFCKEFPVTSIEDPFDQVGALGGRCSGHSMSCVIVVLELCGSL